MEYKDYLGQEIEVGDIIVYPVRQGSRMWMETAEVIDRFYNTDWSTEELKVKKATGKITTVQALERCIVCTPDVEFEDELEWDADDEPSEAVGCDCDCEKGGDILVEINIVENHETYIVL